MAQVTLTVLEGLERGQVLRNLQTPVTIGREEENDIQLNDERISRLHAKLQEDHNQILFTDLNSTNGSRVNGHPVQLRVLRPGDHLQIGRCTLLFGSDEEIADRAQQLGVDIMSLLPLSRPPSHTSAPPPNSDDSFSVADNLTGEQMLEPLFPGGRPPLPADLSPGQRARICDVITYLHERLKYLILDGKEQDADPQPTLEVPWDRWQDVLLMQRDLAQYLMEVANPEP